MQIGELAAISGFSIDTIRFYEKRGLLSEKHFTRQSNRYRDYTERAVSRLELIKRGQCIGLTLSEIGNSIDAWEANQLTVEEKEAFFLHKLDEIDARIAQLEEVKAYLLKKLRIMGELGWNDVSEDDVAALLAG